MSLWFHFLARPVLTVQKITLAQDLRYNDTLTHRESEAPEQFTVCTKLHAVQKVNAELRPGQLY